MTQDTAPKTDAKPTGTAQSIKAPSPGRRDSKPRSRKRSLTGPLTDMFTSAGAMVSIANQADGVAIIQGAKPLAQALNNVAKDNETVYRNLDRMLTGSAWGSVITAAAAIIVPIMANHNLLPFEIPGMSAPANESTPQPSDAGYDAG